MNKIFLDDLPKKYGLGVNSNKLCIDWGKCIGYKVRFIYKDIEGQIEIINYDGKYLTIKYLDKFFNIVTGNFTRCRLGNLLNKHTKYFKFNIGDIFKDSKRDIILIDNSIKYHLGNKYKYYKYKCNKCGWEEGWILEGHLLKGVGCSCCTSHTVVQGINDIPTTAPWMVKYFQGGYDEAKLYTKSSDKSINMICPDCGKTKNFKIIRLYNQHNISCQKCGDGKSYPEKFAFNLLEQLNINFISEYNPDWIKPRRYDFYFKLNDKEYILEMDGGLGHGNKNNLNGKTAEETKNIDNYKDLKAKENNIEIIRINCKISDLEYIKNNILHSRLNELFDLSNINWLKCHEYACKSIVKEISNLWNSNINSTIDIAKIANIHCTTVRRYLKLGRSLGWNDYDEIIVKKNAPLKNNVKVICLNTLEIFNSLNEAADKYNILYVCISSCCRKISKSAGKLPDGTKLKWMYYDEYLKENEVII